ncbi:hypothetical protein DSLASN_39850 [Desulfoluna limicola]|uniref:Uncharacterized protein n=1 Tax=Desulfoluna limicola TaxID=2810562 RepID=A0ABM7PLP8_9BACT|nr:hypothetical protein [Desulfoluna limicola]BCS98353.1 hypothetical protein DSLASN_39850 [Desulfoluna limicola]
MGGLKFLITLFVIYLIFRSIMRKVLSAVNSEGGGALKGKLGDVIEQMKREMEKAKLEAEQEAAGMDEGMSDDPWAELREASDTPLDGRRPWEEELLEEEAASPVASHERWDAEDERPSLHERWNAGDEAPALHERWDAAEDEAPSLWDSTDEDRAPKVATAAEVTPGRCRSQGKRHKRRMRLKEAVIWKEVLDRPIGLRS